MKKRILLTGGSGFVGANLASKLLTEGHELHLFLRPGADTWRLGGILPHVRVHEADLRDAASVVSAVNEVRPEWIFHLAVHGAYPFQNDMAQIVATNVLGACNLADACIRAGFESFVHSGSSSEYGLKDHAPAEDEAIRPNSLYAVTKAAATLHCLHLAKKHDLRMTTLRFYSVYGPYEEPSRFFPALVLNGLRGEWPPLASPNVARDYVYVEDVAEACIAVASHAKKGGAVYNVGTGRQTTLAELVSMARERFGIPTDPKWGSMANRSWDTDVWVADIHRIQKELGWSPGHSLKEGFEKTVKWFSENDALCRGRYAAGAVATPEHR